MKAVISLLALAGLASAENWTDWIKNLGHDTYAYPLWIQAQQTKCVCRWAEIAGGSRKPHCTNAGVDVSWRAAITANDDLDFCTAKAWLLDHMPEFDRHYLPGSVTVNGSSMLDDTVAFALMSDRAAAWSGEIPLQVKLAYVLPYASYHEARSNWRPLFFAKFFPIVANATNVSEALGRLVAPNEFTRWAGHYWAGSDAQPPASGAGYTIEWGSSTAPPVVAPLDLVAWGYGSCSAWATMLSYVARAVGVPARQAGTPCWNSVGGGGVDYRGRAATNPNVSLCWAGGSADRGHGGGFLNNHNWAEVWLPGPERGAGGEWQHINVPPASKAPDQGLCGAFDPAHGCGFDAGAPAGHECDGVRGGPGAAMADHEIFAVTWAAETGAHEGGPVVDVAGLALSDGTAASPLVWSPRLSSPLGEPLRSVGLRVVNRTDAYRCKPTAPGATPGGRARPQIGA